MRLLKPSTAFEILAHGFFIVCASSRITRRHSVENKGLSNSLDLETELVLCALDIIKILGASESTVP